MRKAQAAMEYLMTYGWAILIVIVVVAALYAMGVFKFGGTVPCSPCFSGDITYVDHTSDTLLVKVGPKAITWSGGKYNTTDIVTVDISIDCPDDTTFDSVGYCDYTFSYTINETGLAKTQDARLHKIW